MYIKNKTKLTKLCKFISVLQYHASNPGEPHISVIPPHKLFHFCYYY